MLSLQNDGVTSLLLNVLLSILIISTTLYMYNVVLKFIISNYVPSLINYVIFGKDHHAKNWNGLCMQREC